MYKLLISIIYLLGAGLFSLITEDGVGEDIFTQVTAKFDEIRHSMANLTPTSSLDEESSDDEGTTPELPPRKYRQDTITSNSTSSKSATKESVKVIPKKTSWKQRPNNNCYEEIDIDDECVLQAEKAKSPSFLNSLIQKSRVKVQHSLSSSSGEENKPDEGLYSVLSNNYTDKSLPLGQNYSLVSKTGPK